MQQLIFYVLLPINFIIFIILSLEDIDFIIKNKLFQKITSSFNKNLEDTEKKITSESFAKKTGFFIGWLILLFVAVVPFLLVFYFFFFVNIHYGIIAFTLLMTGGLFWPSQNNIAKIKKGILLNFYFQVVLFFIFSFSINLNEMLLMINNYNFFASNTIIFFLPIFLFFSLLSNAYFYFLGFNHISNKGGVVKKVFSVDITIILLIFIFSSIFGILFFAENELEFLNLEDNRSFSIIFDTFIFLLSAIIIPVVFNLISKKEKN